jgi:hypothetical protein
MKSLADMAVDRVFEQFSSFNVKETAELRVMLKNVFYDGVASGAMDSAARQEAFEYAERNQK